MLVQRRYLLVIMFALAGLVAFLQAPAEAQETTGTIIYLPVVITPPHPSGLHSEAITWIGNEPHQLEGCDQAIYVGVEAFQKYNPMGAFDTPCSIVLPGSTQSSIEEIRFVVVPNAEAAEAKLQGDDINDAIGLWYLGEGYAYSGLYLLGELNELYGNVGNDGNFENIWLDYERPATHSIYENHNGNGALDLVLGEMLSGEESFQMITSGVTSYYDLDGDGPDWADQGISFWRDLLAAT